MTTTAVLGIISLVITFSIFLSNVIFRTGHLSARVEELERWRTGIRDDMHEISDKIEGVGTDIKSLKVLIDERTERRMVTRS